MPPPTTALRAPLDTEGNKWHSVSMLIRGGAEKVRGRVLAAMLLAVGVLVVGAVPSGSQEPPPPEEVAIDESFGLGQLLSRDCDGQDETYPGYAAVLLSRTVVGGGDLTGELVVGVAYSGPEAANLLSPPSEVVFEEGSELGIVDVELLTPGTGSLTITLQPGPGYVLVGATSVTVDLSGEELVNDCTAALTGAGDAAQTIAVGARPDPFFPLVEDPLLGDALCLEFVVDGTYLAYCSVDDEGGELFAQFLETPVVGALPPGLGYADDTWTGAATTPGVYPFEVRLCEDLGAFDDFFDDLLGEGVEMDEVDPEALKAGGELRDRVARRSLSRAAARADEEDLFCVGTLDAEITVVAAVAPAAVPVRAPARLTG